MAKKAGPRLRDPATLDVGASSRNLAFAFFDMWTCLYLAYCPVSAGNETMR